MLPQASDPNVTTSTPIQCNGLPAMTLYANWHFSALRPTPQDALEAGAFLEAEGVQ